MKRSTSTEIRQAYSIAWNMRSPAFKLDEDNEKNIPIAKAILGGAALARHITVYSDGKLADYGAIHIGRKCINVNIADNIAMLAKIYERISLGEVYRDIVLDVMVDDVPDQICSQHKGLYIASMISNVHAINEVSDRDAYSSVLSLAAGLKMLNNP